MLCILKKKNRFLTICNFKMLAGQRKAKIIIEVDNNNPITTIDMIGSFLFIHVFFTINNETIKAKHTMKLYSNVAKYTPSITNVINKHISLRFFMPYINIININVVMNDDMQCQMACLLASM